MLTEQQSTQEQREQVQHRHRGRRDRQDLMAKYLIGWVLGVPVIVLVVVYLIFN